MAAAAAAEYPLQWPLVGHRARIASITKVMRRGCCFLHETLWQHQWQREIYSVRYAQATWTSAAAAAATVPPVIVIQNRLIQAA